MQPLVSVILPLCNEGPYILECLDSIVSQKTGNVEICISDNASSDNTWDAVCELQQRYSNIKSIRQNVEIHPFDNIKEAFSLASGSYVVLMGGDDYLLPGTLDAAIQAYAEFPDLRAFVLNVNYFDDSSRAVFASLPPDHFRQKINGSRCHLIKFVTRHINHDELVLAVFRRADYERALALVHQSAVEPVGLWIFLAVTLLNDEPFPQIRISENVNLMKRYGKPTHHESKFAKSANKMEQTRSAWNCIDEIFQYQKMFGSIATITRLRKAGIIDWRQMIYLLISPRYHSDYGLCFLGPVFHPFWRTWRGASKLVARVNR